MILFRKIKMELHYWCIQIFRYFKVKLYLNPKLSRLYQEHINDKDEFNKSLDMQTWYAINLSPKQLKKYLKDLSIRRENAHNMN